MCAQSASNDPTQPPPCLKPKPKDGLITPTNPTTEVHPWPHNLIRATFAATTPPLIRAVLIVLIRLAVVIHTIVGTTHEQGRLALCSVCQSSTGGRQGGSSRGSGHAGPGVQGQASTPRRGCRRGREEEGTDVIVAVH